MVCEHCVRGPHVAIARRLYPQAEVDIVEGDAQLFIEAFNSVPCFAFDGQAGACDTAELLMKLRPAEIARMVFVEELVRVARYTSDANDDAIVLGSAIWIEQFCADCADTIASCVRDEFFQPVVMENFNIVVEQENDAASGFGHPFVDKP